VRDALARDDLFHDPLGCPGRQHDALGSQAVIAEREGVHLAGRVGAGHAVLLPAKRHGHPTKGKVGVVNDRALLHPRSQPATWTDGTLDDLLDRELADRAAPGTRKDAHVLQADEVGNDLVRIDEHRGVGFLFHRTRLKRLCA